MQILSTDDSMKRIRRLMRAKFMAKEKGSQRLVFVYAAVRSEQFLLVQSDTGMNPLICLRNFIFKNCRPLVHSPSWQQMKVAFHQCSSSAIGQVLLSNVHLALGAMIIQFQQLIPEEKYAWEHFYIWNESTAGSDSAVKFPFFYGPTNSE